VLRIFKPRLVAAFFRCVLTSAGVYAQSTNNQQISGQVTDPSGSSVPHASVKVVGVDTDLTRTAPTN
jgi:hypothetical protein